jgi:hypothetical protein
MLNIDVNHLNTSVSVLNVDVTNNFVNNTILSILSDAVDNQFEITTTYIDDKTPEQHEYTYQEIEALRTEGNIQEALTQLLAWATSDEGKRFLKKLWARISSKWLLKIRRRPYTELLDDVGHATSDELDDVSKHIHMI